MRVEVIEGNNPAKFVNRAVFQTFGFGGTFLDDPGRGDAFYFDAVVVRIDEDILLLQTIHQGLLKAGTLPVVLRDV